MRASIALILASLVITTPAGADEGKWTPQQVLELGQAWVAQRGFTLPLDRLWNTTTGGGLLANAVQLPGCSGSFISADGLLVTNHHCVVSILQEHSTPQANLGKDGFLARTRADEKASKSYRIQVPRAFRDVTREVLALIPAGADDVARFKAVDAAEKSIVAACEKQPGTRCQFATFDGGLFFTLTEFEEIRDVRLVYAPPEQVANFGGEIDNWMWPRHSGDFSLLRAYVNGEPYKPKYWFPVSPDGVKPGDAIAVLGYPGRSYRSFVADEMAEREQKWFPAVRDVNAEWIRILEQAGARSTEIAIAVEDELRSLENTRKNAEGQVAGMRRGAIVEKQRQADARVKAWVGARPEGKEALAAYDGLVKINTEKLQTWDRDFLLDLIARGPRALRWPTQLARRATEGVKPDAEREAGYMDRDLPRLRDQVERDQQRYIPAVDKALLKSWLRRARALPEGQRIAAVDHTFSRANDDVALDIRIDELYASSKIFDLATRKAMFDERPDVLKARRDPLITLGFALDAERLRLKATRDAAAGATLRLRPTWRRAVIAEAGRPVAPDANSTLRVTFGRVEGYTPREGLTATPQTTLDGVMQKHTGQDPFDVPESVRRAYASAKGSRWRDASLGQVPVDFLATADTTGGNSGSPTIDGKGRLVGVNFDRVWENVANDFGYNPEIARNVNADIRYLLWLLDDVAHATELLKELGVR